MAVFLLNICKFNGCGRSFSQLGELILHIEEKHIGKNSHFFVFYFAKKFFKIMLNMCNKN